MSLPADAVTALDTFQKAAGWEQRARLLMQWGERLPALSDAQMCDANRVHGCESQVCATVIGSSAPTVMHG